MSAAAGRRRLESELQAALQRLSSRLVYPGRSLTYQALRSGILQHQLPWVEVLCQLLKLEERLCCATLARDAEVVRAIAQFTWAHAPLIYASTDSAGAAAGHATGTNAPMAPAPPPPAAAAAAGTTPAGCTTGTDLEPAEAGAHSRRGRAPAAAGGAAAASKEGAPAAAAGGGGVRRTRSSAGRVPAAAAAAAAGPPAASSRAAKRRALPTTTAAAAAAAVVATAAAGVEQQQPLCGEALYRALLAGRREWQEAVAAATAAEPAATILLTRECCSGLSAFAGLLGVSCCGCVLQAAVPYSRQQGLVLLAKNFAPTTFMQLVRCLSSLRSPGFLQDQHLWCQLLGEAARGQTIATHALQMAWATAGDALLGGPGGPFHHSSSSSWEHTGGSSSSGGGAAGAAAGGGASGGGGAGPSSSHGLDSAAGSSAAACGSNSGSSSQSIFASQLQVFLARSGSSVTTAALAKCLVSAAPGLFAWHSAPMPASRGLVQALCSGAVYAAAAGDPKVCELQAAALAELLEAPPAPAPAAALPAGGGAGIALPAAAAAGGGGGGAGGAPQHPTMVLTGLPVAAVLAAAHAHQIAATEALTAAGAALAVPGVAEAMAGAAAAAGGEGDVAAVAEGDAAAAVAAMNVLQNSLVTAQANAQAALSALEAVHGATGGQQIQGAGGGAGPAGPGLHPSTAGVTAALAQLQAASAGAALLGPTPAADFLAVTQSAAAAMAATAAATAQTLATLGETGPALAAAAVAPAEAAIAPALAAMAPAAPGAAAAALAAAAAAAGAMPAAAEAAAIAAGAAPAVAVAVYSNSASPVPGTLVELLHTLLRAQDPLAHFGAWNVLHKVSQSQQWGVLAGHLLQRDDGGAQMQVLLDGMGATLDCENYSYVHTSTLQRLMQQDLLAGQAAVRHKGLMTAAMQQLATSPWLWFGAAPGIVQLMTQGAGPAAVAACPRVLTQLLSQNVLDEGQVQEVLEGLLADEAFLEGLLAGVAAAEEAWLRLLWRDDVMEVTNVATAHPGLPEALAQACRAVDAQHESLSDLLMFFMTADPGQAYLDEHPVLLEALAARLSKGGDYALPVWYMGNLWFNDEGPVWLLRHPQLLEAVARALVNNQGHWDSEAVAMELSTRPAFQEAVLRCGDILDQLIKVCGAKARGTTQQLVQPCNTILQGLAASEATLILEQRAAVAAAGEAAAAAAGGVAAGAAAVPLPPPAAPGLGVLPAIPAEAAAAAAAPPPPPPPPPAAAAAVAADAGGGGGPPAAPLAAMARRPPIVDLVLQRAAHEDPDIQAGVWEAISILHKVLLASVRLQLMTPLQRLAAAGQQVQACEASLASLQAGKRAVEQQRDAVAETTAAVMQQTGALQQRRAHGCSRAPAGGSSSSRAGVGGGQGGVQHAGEQVLVQEQQHMLEAAPGMVGTEAGSGSREAAAAAGPGRGGRQKRGMEGAGGGEEGRPSKRTRGQRRR